ncbi:uncharacterized protein LOC107036466 isoform X2 [Diachasma alloeum]|uniref:uncharacterized protein LOC107036466 isoform X2 n=1 Tax=Diachasma alloeum TaxID=454923 RepID=UPI0007382AB3|nr:uncharacterized protein LOC107036466 isoform X2 [Diachasma alloeum]
MAQVPITADNNQLIYQPVYNPWTCPTCCQRPSCQSCLQTGRSGCNCARGCMPRTNCQCKCLMPCRNMKSDPPLLNVDKLPDVTDGSNMNNNGANFAEEDETTPDHSINIHKSSVRNGELNPNVNITNPSEKRQPDNKDIRTGNSSSEMKPMVTNLAEDDQTTNGHPLTIDKSSPRNGKPNTNTNITNPSEGGQTITPQPLTTYELPGKIVSSNPDIRTDNSSAKMKPIATNFAEDVQTTTGHPPIIDESSVTNSKPNANVDITNPPETEQTRTTHQPVTPYELPDKISLPTDVSAGNSSTTEMKPVTTDQLFVTVKPSSGNGKWNMSLKVLASINGEKPVELGHETVLNVLSCYQPCVKPNCSCAQGYVNTKCVLPRPCPNLKSADQSSRQSSTVTTSQSLVNDARDDSFMDGQEINIPEDALDIEAHTNNSLGDGNQMSYNHTGGSTIKVSITVSEAPVIEVSNRQTEAPALEVSKSKSSENGNKGLDNNASGSPIQNSKIMPSVGTNETYHTEGNGTVVEVNNTVFFGSDNQRPNAKTDGTPIEGSSTVPPMSEIQTPSTNTGSSSTTVFPTVAPVLEVSKSKSSGDGNETLDNNASASAIQNSKIMPSVGTNETYHTEGNGTVVGVNNTIFFGSDNQRPNAKTDGTPIEGSSTVPPISENQMSSTNTGSSSTTVSPTVAPVLEVSKSKSSGDGNETLDNNASASAIQNSKIMPSVGTNETYHTEGNGTVVEVNNTVFFGSDNQRPNAKTDGTPIEGSSTVPPMSESQTSLTNTGSSSTTVSPSVAPVLEVSKSKSFGDGNETLDHNASGSPIQNSKIMPSVRTNETYHTESSPNRTVLSVSSHIIEPHIAANSTVFATGDNQTLYMNDDPDTMDPLPIVMTTSTNVSPPTKTEAAAVEDSKSESSEDGIQVSHANPVSGAKAHSLLRAAVIPQNSYFNEGESKQSTQPRRRNIFEFNKHYLSQLKRFVQRDGESIFT